MKINVKIQKEPEFQIEVNPADTVDIVKQNIEDVLGFDQYPKARQIIIFRGNILKDGTTLDKNGIMNNNTIVVMVPKLQKDIEITPGKGSSINTGTAAAIEAYIPDLSDLPLSNTSHDSLAPPEVYDVQEAFNLFQEAVDEYAALGGEHYNVATVTRQFRAALNNMAIPDTGLSDTSYRLPLLSLEQICNTLQQILEEFEEANPIFFNQIQTRPIDFLCLMKETEQVEIRVPSEQVVSAFLQSKLVTPEDHAAIARGPVLKNEMQLKDQLCSRRFDSFGARPQ